MPIYWRNSLFPGDAFGLKRLLLWLKSNVSLTKCKWIKRFNNSREEDGLNYHTRITLYGLCVLLYMTSLTHCSESTPTTNQVQPIEPAAFDKMISDSAYRGLVVAMASWCPPCREELPILAKLYLKYKEKGVQIMAVSLDADGPKAVQPLINELKVPFPVYWIGTKAIKHYKIVGVPTLMIYNDGGLIEKLPGSYPKKIIEQKLQSLVVGSN